MLIAEPFRSAAPRPRAAPSRLVLFVGAAVRPDGALAEALARDGVRALCLAGPEQVLRASRLAVFDALVMEAALVEGAAGHLLAACRSTLRCPILVVAREADEIDEIVALELGADAFLSGSVAPRRLRAHLSALLRRPAQRNVGEGAMAVGGWRLDPLRQTLVAEPGGREITLTEVQTLLLQCLFEAEGALVARARLAAALPGGEQLRVRSVDVYISRLRLRLREEGAHGLQIEAVRGRGFVLRAAPEPATAEAA